LIFVAWTEWKLNGTVYSVVGMVVCTHVVLLLHDAMMSSNAQRLL